MGQHIHELHLPLFFPMTLDDKLIFNELTPGRRCLVAAETKELAEEIFRKVFPNQAKIVAKLFVAKSPETLLEFLQTIVGSTAIHESEYIGLKLRNGEVGSLHIPTIITLLEAGDTSCGTIN